MRFFSNEAKENTDAPEYDENDPDRPQQVGSDTAAVPATVPQQRAGSPWMNAPGAADDRSRTPDDSYVSEHAQTTEVADRSGRDGTEELRADDSEVRHDGDDLVRDDSYAAPTSTDDTVAENSASENSVSENSVSENSAADNRGSANSFSADPVSDNGVSEASFSDNRGSANSFSADPVSEERDSSDPVHADGVSSDPVSADTASGDRVSSDPVSEDGVSEDRVSEDGVSSGPVFEDRLSGDHVSEDQDVDLPLDDHDGTAESTTTYRPDGTVSTDSVDTTDKDGVADEDGALRDEGGFDSPEAVEPVTGESLETARTDEDDDFESGNEPVATDADDTVDEPDVADAPDTVTATTDDAPDTVTATSADTSDTAAATTADTDTAEAAPVAAVVPVATSENGTVDQKPGSVPAPVVGKLFADGDSFAERFRDVQLRFVDSPKEATAEAATLVSEAVDKVTSSLKAQKDSLASNSEDTEQLRVELRGYRDMLNRLSTL